MLSEGARNRWSDAWKETMQTPQGRYLAECGVGPRKIYEIIIEMGVPQPPSPEQIAHYNEFKKNPEECIQIIATYIGYV